MDQYGKSELIKNILLLLDKTRESMEEAGEEELPLVIEYEDLDEIINEDNFIHIENIFHEFMTSRELTMPCAFTKWLEYVTLEVTTKTLCNLVELGMAEMTGVAEDGEITYGITPEGEDLLGNKEDGKDL